LPITVNSVDRSSAEAGMECRGMRHVLTHGDIIQPITHPVVTEAARVINVAVCARSNLYRV